MTDIATAYRRANPRTPRTSASDGRVRGGRRPNTGLSAFEGTIVDRRSAGWRPPSYTPQELAASWLTMLQQRSRDLGRMAPPFITAIQAIADNVIGDTGVRITPRPYTDEIGQAIDQPMAARLSFLWEDWNEAADIDGRQSFAMISQTAIREFVEAGESLLYEKTTPKKHRGKAIVFRDYNHMMEEINREDLDVTADHVMVLQNAGPKGGPGMPEWGMLPIPTKLVKQGVRDMLRVSDGRMSGTSYGACILHVSPESFVGGPLALVKTGDEIEISVGNRTITLCISDEEMAGRKAAWVTPEPRYGRGYGRMFQEHIAQAEDGCDFDFLESGPATPEPEIH